MTFKEQNYVILKNAIDKKLAEFLYNYFLIKEQVSKTLLTSKYISKFSMEWGTWSDAQCPGTYSHYADVSMETLLLMLKPKMEEATGLRLTENYSYARLYRKGNELKRHKDRFSCEISTTLNLGGDEWPIYIEAHKNVGSPDDGFASITNNEGTKVILNPGDMLIYKGNICEHWREPFEGNDCVQVFLHYNNVETEGSSSNLYDGRPHIGLPSFFKGKKID
mgnify:CR=1 FL=1